jgi:hypothetical protein
LVLTGVKSGDDMMYYLIDHKNTILNLPNKLTKHGLEPNTGNYINAEVDELSSIIPIQELISQLIQ